MNINDFFRPKDSVGITEDALTGAATTLGCSVAALKAVLKIEAAGHGFNSQGRLKLLFEPHKFYAHLGKGAKRTLAVKKGLAYKDWRPGEYPKDSYVPLMAAMAIDEEAALKSCSYGLSQILGEHYALLGYASVQEFVRFNVQGERNQLGLMVQLILAWKLDDELQDANWSGFARVWNGKSYEKNGYHTKLKEAFDSFGGGITQRKAPFTQIVSLGDTGDLVRELQRLLTSAGHPVAVDGDYGPGTKRAVRLFQLEHGLVGDGKVGPKTWAALRTAKPVEVPEARATASVKEVKQVSAIAADADKLKKAGQVGAGTLAVVGAANELGVFEQIQGTMDQITALRPMVDQIAVAFNMIQSNWVLGAILGLMGVSYFASRILRSRVEDHQSGRTL